MKQLTSTFACLILATVTFAQQSPWTSLFDGKTLNGWKRLAGTAEYTVENGAILHRIFGHTGDAFPTGECLSIEQGGPGGLLCKSYSGQDQTSKREDELFHVMKVIKKPRR